ncbi:MAG: glycosyltransferase family 2 protein [Sideroxydans sp.]|nr:glycosyltransferase family 2 protein [Sideroxydans sp.]
MPSFNQVQFIDESIASVLSQSYQRLELIVADGGSTDGTQAVLARWQVSHRRVRWMSEPDSGPAEAINKALGLVRGTYVGWLNSDDLYTAGAVQRAMDKLTHANDYVMVYGQAEHINAQGSFLAAYPTLAPSVGMHRFAEGCFICQPTVFFRRSMVLLLGKLDASLKTSFDFDYWLRAFCAFPQRIGFVDAVQAKSRLHDACITQKMRRTVALEALNLLKKHMGQAPLHWMLTHFREARQSGQPDLEQYLKQLIDEAHTCFSDEELQVLRHAAQVELNATADVFA